MCTAGLINKRYLFKNRDMKNGTSGDEDIVMGHGVYRYIGVCGHATPKERGFNSGINEKGVCLEMTYVGKEGLEGVLNSGDFIPRGVLIEEVLRSAASLEQALDIACGLLNRHRFVSGNILINSPQGAAVIEEWHPAYAVFVSEGQYEFRANHFDGLSDLNKGLSALDNSLTRERRITDLFLEKGLDDADVAYIKRALSDHENGADAICRHGESGLRTVSSVVFDIKELSMHYCHSAPCAGEFDSYAFGKDW